MRQPFFLIFFNRENLTSKSFLPRKIETVIIFELGRIAVMISENSIWVRVFSFGRKKLIEKNFSVVVTSCQQNPAKKSIAEN
jgi:hypothetical protein